MSLLSAFPHATVLMPLTLFQRDDCHLCDQALALLAQAHAPAFNSVFIDGDAELEARYGARVPVLRDERSGMEMDWPFAVEPVREMIATRSPHERVQQMTKGEW